MPAPIRKIIHIDMDAFYASVEQRDNPDLQDKAIAVGGSEKRGVVTTCSYEARKFGVRSAMPGLTAKKKCPHIIFVKPRFDIYREVSKHVMNILYDYSDLVEPMSLDEAYLDVTVNKKGITSATKTAEEIKARIKSELKLTASAGVSVNKFLAKVASDMDKPNGLYIIPPGKTEKFIDKLIIEKVPGIGKVTSRKMHELGIKTCSDLKKYSKMDLNRLFGKTGKYYYDIVHGEYDNPVKPHRIRKSVSSERTFPVDITATDEMLKKLETITGYVVKYIDSRKIMGKTITLKIKYNDFMNRTRSRSLNEYVSTFDEIFPVVEELLFHPEPPDKPVRLLGVGLSNLNIHEDEPSKDQLAILF